MLSHRVKLGLVAATAAMGTLGGVGLADAAPSHITQPQTGLTSYPGDHVPDGTRITGLSVKPGHSWANGVASAAAVEGQAANAASVPVTVADGITQRGPRPGTSAPPPVAGPTSGMTAMAGYQWFPGRVGAATGVRIRASIPSGTVLGQLPRYGHVWLWCQAHASNGTHWFWTAYNTGSRWIYGYASMQYLYPSPDRSIPTC